MPKKTGVDGGDFEWGRGDDLSASQSCSGALIRPQVIDSTTEPAPALARNRARYPKRVSAGSWHAAVADRVPSPRLRPALWV